MLFWGSVILMLVFFVDDIVFIVLEIINKIGLLINGFVLVVFILGVLIWWCYSFVVIVGLLCGFLFNIYFWLGYLGIFWLWWNLIGFVVVVLVVVLVLAVCFLIVEEVLLELDDELLFWLLF